MKTHRVVSLLLAFVVVVASALFGPTARAGTLHLRDTGHALSSEDVARVRAAVEAAPFDARLLVTTQYPDAQELARAVHALATEQENVVAIGLDPEHRHVQVRFEEHVRIPRTAWPEIERAGNDAFRGHRWGDGLATIIQTATSAAQPGSGVAAPAASRVSLLGPGLLLLLVVAAVGVGVYFSSRRRGTDYLPPGGGGGYGPGPGYGPGGYGAGGGMGPLGGGLVGAGLGGLAGYELGKLAGEREERDRERPDWSDREDLGGRDDGPEDAGGGGSSWDDDGSSGGGGDGGGDFGGDGGGGDF